MVAGIGGWTALGSVTVILRCERSESRRIDGQQPGHASFETRFALLRMTGIETRPADR